MNLLPKRRGIHAAVALAALATLFPLAVSAQQVQVEIQIRDSFPYDDYLTWSPAPAQIRIVPGATPGRDRLVVLTNDPQGPIPEGRTAPLDGDVLFAESVRPGQTATQETLKLVLPGNGTWRPFVIAGKFGRASTRDKDAIVQVHLDSATGPVVGTHALMVRIRKDARTLTAGERDRLLQAIAHVRFDLGTYETFVDVHQQAAMGKELAPPHYWPDQSHRKAGFLAWHRAFLLQFEREIQKDFPDVALAYWRIPEPSNVFTPEFMGANPKGDGKQSVPPDFTPSNPLQFWEIQGKPLLRFDADRNALGQFRSESDSLKPDSYAVFRAVIEGNPHNNGHNWVGPWMQDCTISPRDPIFWVFHGEFDRLWAKWQWTFGRFGTAGAEPKDYAPVGTYDPNVADCKEPVPNNCIPLGHWLQDRMWPWDETSGPGVNYGANRPPQRYGKFPASPVPGLWPATAASPTPADMIDYEGFNAGIREMGFAYDDVPFGAKPKALFQPESVQAAAPAPEAAPLGRLLADREQPDEIRVAALRRLADQDVAAAVDRALQILRDPQDGGSELDAETLDLLNIQMMFTNEGTQRHGEIHAALRRALTDPRRPVRLTALRNLATHGDPAVVKAVTDALARPEGALFEPAEAIRTLTVAGVGENAAVVRPYLDSPDPDVRAAAVTALLGDPVSQPRIVALIADGSQPLEVREAAIHAVARGVPGAAEAVTALLAAPETDPRLRARAEAAVAFRQRSQKKENQ